MLFVKKQCHSNWRCFFNKTGTNIQNKTKFQADLINNAGEAVIAAEHGFY